MGSVNKKMQHSTACADLEGSGLHLENQNFLNLYNKFTENRPPLPFANKDIPQTPPPGKPFFLINLCICLKWCQLLYFKDERDRGLKFLRFNTEKPDSSNM